MSKSPIKIPSALIQAAREENLVLFVGAGLSYNFKNTNGVVLKGWDNLVNHIVTHLQSIQGIAPPPIDTTQTPLEILEKIEPYTRKFKSEIIQAVSDFYTLSDDNDFSLHKSLYKLSKLIITTNYDNAFEWAGKPFKPDFKTLEDKYPVLEGDHESLLFKVHGSCCDNKTHLIIFPQDYKELYETQIQDSERIFSYLQTLIITKSILFIGYGMGDFQVNNIFLMAKKLLGNNNQSHFIITKDNLRDNLGSFLERIPIHDFSEIQPLINQIIEEKQNNKQTFTFTEKFRRIKKDILNDVFETHPEALAIKYFLQGMDLQHYGKYKEAIEKYRSAIKLNDKNSQYYTNWGAALYSLAVKDNYNQKQLEGSFDKFEKAIKLDPHDDRAHHNWGMALFELAKIKNDMHLFENSRKQIEKAISLSPTNYFYYNNLSTIYYEMAQRYKNNSWFEECIRLCEKFLALNTDYPEVYCRKGLSYYYIAISKQEAGLFRKSIRVYAEGIQKHPDNPYILNNWGLSLYQLGVLENSVSILNNSCDKFSELSQITPDYEQVYYNWGNSLFQVALLSDNVSLFEESLTKYKKSNPDQPR
ncbi:MAG: SIR2 family protein [Bacteroides sp.]|nr:SIR2 family protein [Bacteroides sp.]